MNKCRRLLQLFFLLVLFCASISVFAGDEPTLTLLPDDPVASNPRPLNTPRTLDGVAPSSINSPHTLPSPSAPLYSAGDGPTLTLLPDNPEASDATPINTSVGALKFAEVGSSPSAPLQSDGGDSDDIVNSSKVFVDTPNDYSIKYLNMLFGNVGSSLNGSLTGQTVGHLFYIFNQGVLIACGIWILFTLVRITGKMIDGNVSEVTKEGKTFISIILGVVLVIPNPSTGYSTIQDVVMKVVVQGVRLANGIWSYQIGQFEQHKHVFDNPPEMQPWNPGDKPGNTLSYARLWWKGGTTLSGQSQNEGEIPTKFKPMVQKILSAEYSYYFSHIMARETIPDFESSIYATMITKIAPSQPTPPDTTSIGQYALQICTVAVPPAPDSDETPDNAKTNCKASAKETFSIKFVADGWGATDSAVAAKANFVLQSGPTIQNQLYYTAQQLAPIAKVYACDAYINSVAPAKTPALCEGVQTLSDSYLKTASAQVIAVYSAFSTVMNGVTANYEMTNYNTANPNSDAGAATGKKCMAPSEETAATDLAQYQKILAGAQYMDGLKSMCLGAYVNDIDSCVYEGESPQVVNSIKEICGVSDVNSAQAHSCLHTIKDALIQMDENEKQAAAFAQEAANPGSCSTAYSIAMKSSFDKNSNGAIGYQSGDAARAIYNRTKSYISDAAKACSSSTTHDIYKAPYNCAAIATANAQMAQPDIIASKVGSLTGWANFCAINNGSSSNKPWQNLACTAISSPSFFTCSREQSQRIAPCTSGADCWKGMLKPYTTYSAGLTCTQALANQMRSKGWIMAGAYYWLIAHQDQLSATNSKFDQANSNDYLYWSPAKRLETALNFTDVQNTSSTLNCEQSPTGTDTDDYSCAPWIAAYWNGDGTSDSSGPTSSGLGKEVLSDLLAQFKNSGGGIGVVDVNTTGYSGISRQLYIAGKGIKNFIQGNSDFLHETSMSPKNEESSDLSKIGGSATSSVVSPSDISVSGAASSFGSGLFAMQSNLFPQMLNQINYLERFILNVSDQLNNPNMDPQALLASVGIGMVYQGFYAYLGYLQMMIQLIVMLLVIAVLTIVLLVSVSGAPLACMGAVEAGLMISYVKTTAGLLKKLGMALITMGLVMAFYLPLYPWIVFSFAVIGWFIAVIEAMAAAPLICLGMTNPQGHELAGSLKQAMMLLLSIFIRPALMIISFILSMIAVRVLLFFVIQGFIIVVGTVFNSNPSDYCSYIYTSDPSGSELSACTGASGNGFYPTNLWSSIFGFASHAADIGTHQYATTLDRAELTPGTESNYATDIGSPVSGHDLFDSRPPALSSADTTNTIGYQPIFQFIMVLFSAPILLGLLTYMAYKVITHAYSLVFLIPEGVVKWIGGQSAGNTSALQQSAEGAKGAAEKSGKSAGKGMGEMGGASEAGAKSGASSAASLGTNSAGSVMSMSQGQSGGGED